MVTFLRIMEEEKVRDRKLKLQPEIMKDDFVVDDTIEYFFTSLFTHLTSPIHLTIENPVEFTAKY